MIDMLNGRCMSVDDHHLVIDVSGVGYGVDATRSLAEGVIVNQESLVCVHTHVREDQITLFGFVDKVERQIFRILIGVNRIGPKVAMAVLSTLSVDEIVSATMSEDFKMFERVPKIGAAQAKKLILELKPKLEKIPELALQGSMKKSGASKRPDATHKLDWQIQGDLQSALVNLGYKDKEASRVVSALADNPVSKDLPELIRLSLRELGGVGMNSESTQSESIF